MRIAVLWTGLSGYLNACLKELASRRGVELLVSHQAPVDAAPYDDNQFKWITNRFCWRAMADLELLPERVKAFAPEIMLVASWHITPYRRLAREYAGTCRRVMTMDNPWRGTLKQWIGVVTAPYYVKSIADAVWLPGERQAMFARKMGFKRRAILTGIYACDRPAFAKVHDTRIAGQRLVPRAFLFAGRFAPEKGVDTLVNAYRAYRARCADPWPLICCGAGPLLTHLQGVPGISIEGFVQPDQMPAKFASAGCFVLASSFEPWGVVVHEATSAGLLVLASETVGAVPHLVRPNYNGFVFGNGDSRELAECLLTVSSLPDARLHAMSQASYLLSKQYSPTLWADTLLESIPA